ncbi:hypothetical protein ACJX0J_038203, partial [Zea mays]
NQHLLGDPIELATQVSNFKKVEVEVAVMKVEVEVEVVFKTQLSTSHKGTQTRKSMSNLAHFLYYMLNLPLYLHEPKRPLNNILNRRYFLDQSRGKIGTSKKCTAILKTSW